MSNCQVFRDSNNEIKTVNAPNGKESLLYNSILSQEPSREFALRAWAQVYTPSFKEWFGDWEKKEGSKVVDENGEPLLVYHGSNQNFQTFDEKQPSKTGYTDKFPGFYFFNNPEAAKGYTVNAGEQFQEVYGALRRESNLNEMEEEIGEDLYFQELKKIYENENRIMD